MKSNARRRAPFHALLAATATGLAFAGCSAEVSVGDGDQASGADIAERVEADYVEKTGIELPRLTCQEVEADVGAELACTGRNARDVELEIGGEVTDTTGDGFDYRWEVVSANAPGVFYERALRRLIEERGVALAEVACPTRIALRRGATVECSAIDRQGARRAVDVRLTDLDGGFEFGIREPGGGETTSG